MARRPSEKKRPGKKRAPLDVWVLGGSGHAKVVVSTLRASGARVRAVLDDAPERHGSSVLGVRVGGPIAVPAEGWGVVAIGKNEIRRKVAERTGARWATAVHPRAAVESSAALGPGTVVFAGAVIQADARVGAHGIVNTGASVDHDCFLGSYVHIGPGARLCGGVEIGDGVFIGAGAVCMPNVRVGAWSTIGAGAVVNRDVPPNVVAAGVPVRILRSSREGG